MKTKLDNLIDAVTATPGASLRPEELLFRFGDDDNGKTVLKGAHVVVLVTSADLSGGISRRPHGPFPVPVLADDPTLRELLQSAELAQQATIEALKAELAHVRAAYAAEKAAAEQAHAEALLAATATATAAEQAHAQALLAATTSAAASQQVLQATIDALRTEAKDREAKIAELTDLLGGTEVGKRLALARDRDAALAAKQAAQAAADEADAKLAALYQERQPA